MNKILILSLVVFIVSSVRAITQDQFDALPPEPEIPVVRVEINELEVPPNKEVILDVYTVKQGDYLAKIAEREYGDRNKWRIIYNYNKYIKNSHWIFPGDTIILPVIVDKLPEVSKVEVKEERDYGNFIATEDFKFSGTIIGFKEEKELNSQGDYIFIDIGQEDDLKVNKRLNIYRSGQYIEHPFTGVFLGNIVEKIGEIQVLGDIGAHEATAKILYSDRPVEIGDMLLIKK